MEIKVGDMVKFQEDRYTVTQGIVEDILPSSALWVRVYAWGVRLGHRLIMLPENCEIVQGIDD